MSSSRSSRSFASVLCALVLIAIGSSFAIAAPLAKGGEVLVIRNPVSAEINSLAVSLPTVRGTVVERVAVPNSGELGIAAASTVTQDTSALEAYCAELIRGGVAKLCSPNYVYTSSLTPNDASYSVLYGLTQTKTNDAWNFTTGSASVVVAVIDTGVQYTHPDLAANTWTNPGEVAGDSTDNDGNGYVDDVHGFDFVTGDGDPLDQNGHGTHVAGTIGAVGNNSIGVVGVNHTVSIQALRVLDASGSGFTSDIIEAVNYAAANGADVINMSLGGPGYSPVFEAAIRDAGTAGVLVVVAAGNESANNNVTPSYPANYGLSNMISVAATDDEDRLASFSNYGSSTVQLAAPGVSIASTYPSSSYAYLSGTSMASPHVAGAAALIKAANPALNAASLRALILDNGDTLENLSGVVSTAKRLNVSASVAASIGATPIPDPTPTVDEVELVARRVATRQYRVGATAYEGASVAGQGIAVRITCTELNGRKKTYRKTGATDSAGLYSPRFGFSSRTTRASCRAQATDFSVSSRKVSVRVR
jgi:subtilisin family serine protease